MVGIETNHLSIHTTERIASTFRIAESVVYGIVTRVFFISERVVQRFTLGSEFATVPTASRLTVLPVPGIVRPMDVSRVLKLPEPIGTCTTILETFRLAIESIVLLLTTSVTLSAVSIGLS